VTPEERPAGPAPAPAGPGPAGPAPAPAGPAPAPAGPGPGPAGPAGSDDTDGATAVVSDFGISARGAPGPPGRRPAARPPADEEGSEDGSDGSEPVLSRGDPRFEVSAQLRRLLSAVVGRLVPERELSEAAGVLRELADRLEEAAGPGRRPRPEPDPTRHPQDFFPTSPVIGFANPVAPPVMVETDGEGGLRGSAWFDYQYEGPPTCVHGGVIALVFDELLGAANIAAGCPGMTGTLTIRYRRPTPLRTDLRLEARCTGRQGRKITTRGAILLGDELLAEAEGLFIELVPERFLRILGAHGADHGGGLAP
jgi:acyl-coenzyme A thioesterase PaaI-like protein